MSSWKFQCAFDAVLNFELRVHFWYHDIRQICKSLSLNLYWRFCSRCWFVGTSHSILVVGMSYYVPPKDDWIFHLKQTRNIEATCQRRPWLFTYREIFECFIGKIEKVVWSSSIRRTSCWRLNILLEI